MNPRLLLAATLLLAACDLLGGGDVADANTPLDSAGPADAGDDTSGPNVLGAWHAVGGDYYVAAGGAGWTDPVAVRHAAP